MATLVYVVVVTFNPKKWVHNCFTSLQNSSITPHIIVVDNGSTDGSEDLIKNNFPTIDFIQTGKNLGFGKANNIGIKKAYDAGADYVFLLNHDAWIEHNTIEILVKSALLNKHYGILSPMHLNGTGEALDYNFSKYILPPKSKTIFSDIYLNKANGNVYDINFINAAAWLISRKCLETVGGFSPSFFHYGEDDNYCERVLFHDLKIGVCPSATIFHDREQRKSNPYFTEDKIFYQRKIVYQLSNPFSNRTRFSYFKSEVKELYLSLVCLNLKDFKKNINHVLILIALDFKTIINTREISKKEGKSFL